jgi:hypothetical protein
MECWRMIGYTTISPDDVKNLEYVAGAVGSWHDSKGAFIEEASASRLLIAGFVQKVDPSIAGNAALVITNEGRRYLTLQRKKAASASA